MHIHTKDVEIYETARCLKGSSSLGKKSKKEPKIYERNLNLICGDNSRMVRMAEMGKRSYIRHRENEVIQNDILTAKNTAEN